MPVIPARLPGLAGVQDTFRRLDLKFKCALLGGSSESEFKPVFMAGRFEEIGFMTIETDRRFFVVGTEDNKKQTIFVVRSPGSAWFEGVTTLSGDMCGFRSGYAHTAAHSEGMVQAIILPLGALRHHLESIACTTAIERMDSVNTIRLAPKLFNDFCHLQELGCNGGIDRRDQVFDMLTVALCSGANNPDAIPSKNWQLALDAVYHAHQHLQGQALSLTDISGLLFASPSCINAACKCSFGCTIGKLMEAMRLAQAHIELAETSSTVRQVMKAYGFSNSGSFASKHRALFGTTPHQQLPLLKYSEGNYVARRIKVELKPYRFRQDLD